MWIITNKNIIDDNTYKGRNYNGFSFYSNHSAKIESQWLRLDHTQNHLYNNEAKKNAKVPDLYDGNFILLRLTQDTFTIYSDPFGIKKFFYWLNGDEFIISGDLKTITRIVDAKLSAENIAVYALTYHFIGGLTAFQNIYYNKPGEVIEFKNGKLSFSYYWDAGNLLKVEKRQISIKEITDKLITIIEKNIHDQPGKRISLSLTGGADTRNLLSVFLRLGIKPHLYTYGNPHSADCVKAKAIAHGLGLEHAIHDIDMTAMQFEEYARRIIRLGGGLASIHRVHRLMAVERERQYAEVMFLGTLGGEFIKGVSEDDYIVPSIIYENWHRPQISTELIVDYCRRKALQTRNIDLEIISDFFNRQPFFNGDVISRKLYSLSYLTASLHDAQDVNLYRTVMDEVYTPFLDVDYLKTVFASRFSFDNKERKKNRYLKRIENPVYASNFLKQVYSPLLHFEYSGNHKPSEVLFNKYTAAVIKSIRTKMRKSYPPNFPLSNWMVEFVERNLPRCRDYEVLKYIFDLDKLQKDLKNEKHLTKESYWLRFTNPIMMMFILEEVTK
jgi:asparagine synthetase B (glutamine-hydrolysing)